MTIAAVRPFPTLPNGGIELGAGIIDIAIPGVSFQQQMKVPDDEPPHSPVPRVTRR